MQGAQDSPRDGPKLSDEKTPLLYDQSYEDISTTEECLTCDSGDPEAQLKEAGCGTEPPADSYTGLWYSGFGGLVGLPFIIGSCCWPLLVGALAGIAVSKTSVMLSHTMQFALLLAVFTNLMQHTLHTCINRRRGSHFSRFGPTYLVFLATILIMVHPTFMVLKDAKKVTPAPHTYTILYTCTISGYIFLMFGTLWATDTFRKIAALFSSPPPQQGSSSSSSR